MSKMFLRGVAIGTVLAGLSLSAVAAPVRPPDNDTALQRAEIQPVYWHRWHHWHHWHHRRWWHHHWRYY